MKKIFSLLAAVLFAGSMMAGQFVRVSDMANLAPGDQIILVSESEDYALGTTQNPNNRAAVAVTVANDVIEAGENVQVITLEASGQNLKLKVGEDAYLYAASSSSNYLKTADAATAGDNAVWAISSSEDTVTLIAQGTNTRNILHFNPNSGNPIFSCYGPTSSVTALVKIFKAEGGDTPALGAWNQVVFTAAAAADAIPEDSIFVSDKAGFQAQIADAGNKMVIDANDCRFGTAQGYEMYNFRLKSGGASSSDKNFITISVPTAGKLGLAVRSGSNSATDRVLYVLQDGDTLYNDVIQESMAIKVIENEDTVKVYPYVTVDAKAGNVIVRYSAGLNFYAFGFNASLAPEAPDTTLVDPTNCAEAAAAALSVSANNELYNNGKVYTIEGYVTEIATAFSEQYKNITFWMADTKDGGKVLEAFRAVCDTVINAPIVGDKVKVTGSLTKYNTTPEFAAGCTFVITEHGTPVEPQNLGEKTIAEFLELKNKVDTCILTGVVLNIKKNDDGSYNKYGNFDLADATDTVYVYGLLTADGVAQKFPEMGVDEGDTLTIKAVYGEYKGTPQAPNAVFVSVKKASQGIEEVMAENEGKTMKFVQGGQIYILRDNKVYGLRGERIR